MSLKKFYIGPFEKIYVGEADDNTMLIELEDCTTGPASLKETLGETRFQGIRKTLQTGLHTMIIPNLVFYGPSDTLRLLARGLPLDETDLNIGPEFTEYTLFFLYPDEDAKLSLYIPRCRIIHDLELNFSKVEVTELPVQIIWEEPDRYTTLYVLEDVDTLDTLMAGRSPL